MTQKISDHRAAYKRRWDRQNRQKPCPTCFGYCDRKAKRCRNCYRGNGHPY